MGSNHLPKSHPGDCVCSQCLYDFHLPKQSSRVKCTLTEVRHLIANSKPQKKHQVAHHQLSQNSSSNRLGVRSLRNIYDSQAGFTKNESSGTRKNKGKHHYFNPFDYKLSYRHKRAPKPTLRTEVVPVRLKADRPKLSKSSKKSRNVKIPKTLEFRNAESTSVYKQIMRVLAHKYKNYVKVNGQETIPAFSIIQKRSVLLNESELVTSGNMSQNIEDKASKAKSIRASLPDLSKNVSVWTTERLVFMLQPFISCGSAHQNEVTFSEIENDKELQHLIASAEETSDETDSPCFESRIHSSKPENRPFNSTVAIEEAMRLFRFLKAEEERCEIRTIKRPKHSHTMVSSLTYPESMPNASKLLNHSSSHDSSVQGAVLSADSNVEKDVKIIFKNSRNVKRLETTKSDSRISWLDENNNIRVCKNGKSYNLKEDTSHKDLQENFSNENKMLKKQGSGKNGFYEQIFSSKPEKGFWKYLDYLKPVRSSVSKKPSNSQKITTSNVNVQVFNVTTGFQPWPKNIFSRKKISPVSSTANSTSKLAGGNISNPDTSQKDQPKTGLKEGMLKLFSSKWPLGPSSTISNALGPQRVGSTPSTFSKNITTPGNESEINGLPRKKRGKTKGNKNKSSRKKKAGQSSKKAGMDALPSDISFGSRYSAYTYKYTDYYQYYNASSDQSNSKNPTESKNNRSRSKTKPRAYFKQVNQVPRDGKGLQDFQYDHNINEDSKRYDCVRRLARNIVCQMPQLLRNKGVMRLTLHPKKCLAPPFTTKGCCCARFAGTRALENNCCARFCIPTGMYQPVQQGLPCVWP